MQYYKKSYNGLGKVKKCNIKGSCLGKVVVHSDLHYGNITFDNF